MKLEMINSEGSARGTSSRQMEVSYIFLLSRRRPKHELLVIDVRDRSNQLSRRDSQSMAKQPPLSTQESAGDFGCNEMNAAQPVGKVIILDVEDRSAPKILRSTEIDGLLPRVTVNR